MQQNLTIKENAIQKKNVGPAKEDYAVRIEKIAAELYDTIDLTVSEMERLTKELVDLLLKYKGLAAFASDSNYKEQLITDNYNADIYSGVVVTECYQHAIKKYGEVDPFTGERFPFLYFFNSLYKKKMNDIYAEQTREKNPWNYSLKEGLLKELLATVKKESSYKGTLPRIRVTNLDKLVEQLQLLDAKESFMELAEALHKGFFVVCDECRTNDDEVMDRYSSDATAIAEHKYKGTIISDIVTLIEYVQNKAKAEKQSAVDKNLIAYVTLRSREYVESGDELMVMLLEPFLDRDLLAFAESCADDNEVQILADYTGQKYNTARKKLRLVEKSFGEVAETYFVKAS